MKLIVGLGNPGRKYEQTRHNIGFEIIDALAQRHALTAARSKFEALVQECVIGSERALLLKPQTFMNLSGRSVQLARDFYKVEVSDLLLVCDDFNLELGTIRLRAGGSDGGQRGLADTIRQLGTDEFPRLRFGIGPVPERWHPPDFVLGKFAESEKETVDRCRKLSCDAIEAWITAGIQNAMNKYNGRTGLADAETDDETAEK